MSRPTPQSIISLPTAVRILVPFCFGYMLSYFSRNIVAILADDFSIEFAINANALGLLTSTYFLAFAVCQIPLGLLLDRFEPARVEAAFLSFAGIGALLSGLAESSVMLSVGRIMMGLGVSACLMASYRAISLYFPKAYIPFANSLILAFGGLGAIFSGWPPTALFVQLFGWHDIFYLLSGGFFLCVILLLFSPRLLHADLTQTDPADNKSTFVSPLNGLIIILSSRIFWSVMPVVAFIQGGMLAINGLWVVPWLVHTQGIPLANVSYFLVGISFSMMIGQLLAGVLGTQQGGGYRGLWNLFLFGSIASIISMGLIIGQVNLPTIFLWGCYALFAPFTMLAYPMILQKYHSSLAGRVLTLMNASVFFCAFFIQWLIGYVIGQLPDHSFAVDLLRFQVAFALPTFAALVSILFMVGSDLMSEIDG